MNEFDVEGYEHVLNASKLLKAVVADLFALPKAAQDRAIAERDRLGEESHGDDLLCGCWAAAISATALLELSGRHLDAVVVLANSAPALSSPAGVTSRAAFEALLRVAWLLEPPAATAREQRWIAFQREEERFKQNVEQVSDAEYALRIAELDRLSDAIPAAKIASLPSVETLARQLTRGKTYAFYRWMSQAVHGTLVGASPFHMDARFDWNAEGGQGEWIEAEFWNMPMIMCWEGARVAVRAYRDLLVPNFPLTSLAAESTFFSELRAVPPNYQARRDLKRRGIAASPSAPPAMNRAQRRAAQRRKRGC